MAKMLVKDFNSQVPDTLEELVKLPGVGRKTANVIQSVVFNKAAMAVDTHVFRVSHRLGLVSDKCTTPFSVEKSWLNTFRKQKFPLPIIGSSCMDAIYVKRVRLNVTTAVCN